MKDDTTKVSDDSVGLRNLVELELPIKTVRWEVFGTPEYTGGVPGPTDYITLIAEVSPADQKTFEARQETGTVWIAPESARPWLTERFRLMLSTHRNTTVDLSRAFNCRRFEARIKTTGKIADGFICNDSGRSLVYLTLASYSGA